ncbi:MAG TPA: ribosome silencing factor [Phycisphaerales bacterium]|nr:ribosome silencing factor [Phycisphaerales bacterium]HBR18628.1 ribosome silencing factor [Phycisphaerales bacterium]
MAKKKTTAKKTVVKKSTIKKAAVKKNAVKKTAVKKKKTALIDSKKFAIEAAKIAIARNCKDVVILDLVGKSPATDYFLIATGTSDRQICSVAEEVLEFGHKHKLRPFGKAGMEQGKWVLLDFVDVVVHLFNEEFRDYYDLELLWGDAEKLEIRSEK